MSYSCPACGADDVGGRDRCKCGADVSLLRALDAAPDAWFNRALKALNDGDPGRALEWVSACCAARPSDGAARRVQAKIWAQLGHWQEAVRALSQSAEIEPDSDEVKEIREALRAAQTRARRRAAKATHRASSVPTMAWTTRRARKRVARNRSLRQCTTTGRKEQARRTEKADGPGS